MKKFSFGDEERIRMGKKIIKGSLFSYAFILAIDLIGAVPDDEQIVVSTNQGEPLVGSDCLAGQAYANICRRILGEEVPFLDLETKSGVWSKFKDLFKKN